MIDYADTVARAQDAPDTCFVCARDLDDDGQCSEHGDPYKSAADRRAESTANNRRDEGGE